MRPRKILLKVCIVLIAFIIFGITLKAEEINEEEVLHYGINLFDWNAIEQLESELKAEAPQLKQFSLKQEVTNLVSGKANLSINYILKQMGNLFLGEIALFLQLGARFILIVLLCNLLQTLSSSFQSKDTMKIGFFVCYMAILLSVVQSFVVMIQLAQQTIDQVLKLMYICIPTLLAFMTTTGYAVSAAAMAPVIITALSLTTYVIRVIVLPCIIWVIVLEIVSSMSEEFKVDQFIKLFYKGIKWTLRGLLVLSVSILSIYRMTLPYADVTVKKAALKFSTAFIPVVGNAVGGAADFLMSCSGLIKNTFSAGVIIWLLLLVSVPLIKIFSYVVVYQIAGALIEPIGDKKMSSIAHKLGKGCEFIMSAVGIVALLCVCSLAICMSVGLNVT